MSFSNMTIILSSTIFEPSQHSVAVTVYHVVMYDCVTRMVRFVMLRMKRRAVRWWSCSRDIFVQLNVSLVWNWCLVRTWRSFWVRVFWAKSTLCGCDCIPCGHVWLCDSNGTVRHVENETKSSALVELLKRHICTIERITGMKLMSRSNMTIILSSSILSQVNTLWLWLYTMWSYTFKRSIYYGINLNLFRT